MDNFKNIEYLKVGNIRQKEAYKELVVLEIFDSLAEFTPILTGTIPIGIDLPESDLDIICECSDHEKFSDHLTDLFSCFNDFKINSHDYYGIKSTVAKFKSENFEIEIFGQDIPVEQQNAYRHMLIEHKIMLEKGPEFKKEVIRLKKEGYKTEPAFAKVLGLEGDPYLELLNL